MTPIATAVSTSTPGLNTGMSSGKDGSVKLDLKSIIEALKSDPLLTIHKDRRNLTPNEIIALDQSDSINLTHVADLLNCYRKAGCLQTAFTDLLLSRVLQARLLSPDVSRELLPERGMAAVSILKQLGAGNLARTEIQNDCINLGRLAFRHLSLDAKVEFIQGLGLTRTWHPVLFGELVKSVFKEIKTMNPENLYRIAVGMAEIRYVDGNAWHEIAMRYQTILSEFKPAKAGETLLALATGANDKDFQAAWHRTICDRQRIFQHKLGHVNSVRAGLFRNAQGVEFLLPEFGPKARSQNIFETERLYLKVVDALQKLEIHFQENKFVHTYPVRIVVPGLYGPLAIRVQHAGQDMIQIGEEKVETGPRFIYDSLMKRAKYEVIRIGIEWNDESPEVFQACLKNLLNPYLASKPA